MYLTRSQHATLQLLARHDAERRTFPSVTELATRLHMKSRATSARVYRWLERKGLIERTRDDWASASLTEDGLRLARRCLDLPPPPPRTGGFVKTWSESDGARSLHQNMVRSIRDDELPLKTGSGLTKLGGRVTKGPLTGATIKYLTLEERATCPTTCALWKGCYGNNMGMSIRYVVDSRLIIAINEQLGRNTRFHDPPLWLIRLHELGDFPSVFYVKCWELWLDQYPWLNAFGYTAWSPETPIGYEIARLKKKFGIRFAIRWSGSTGRDGSTVRESLETPVPEGSFPCPQQLARTDNCGTCAACWGTDKAVSFANH